MEKAKILIVDDDQDFTMVTKTILENEQYSVITADSKKEGMEKIENEKPELIILDVMMPNMDGYELLQEMKSDKDLEKIPVLIYSALSTDNSKKKVYELGADGFIIKPIEPHRLIEQMGKVLKRKKLIDENKTKDLPNSHSEMRIV